MPDEELSPEEQPETPDVETPETPEVPEAPAFDVEAERTRIREEERASLRTEMEGQGRPVQEEEPDIDTLMFENPAAYRAALTKQITDGLMAQVQPLLGRLNQDVVARELGSGLGDAGQKYLRDTLGNVPIDTLPPQLKEMARLAAENVDRKSTPVKTTQERPYGERSYNVDITDEDRKMYGIGSQYGPTEAEVRAWKKEEMETARR